MSELKCEIYSKTGIPAHVQHLLYGRKKVGSEKVMHTLPDQSNITLNIKLLRGQNECEVCFGTEVYCTDCEQYLCNDCNYRVHRHPKRAHHTPNSIVLESVPQTETSCPMETSVDSPHGSDDEYDMVFSPSLEKSFHEATLIATLAERFQMTSFRDFQKAVIEATINGKDSLVICPTGSGKSLCFQFPPIYMNKKAIIVTPTISLMYDQVEKLNSKGIHSIFLGSAQKDKHAETRALEPTSDVTHVFVTPEWITKPENKHKLHLLKVQIG